MPALKAGVLYFAVALGTGFGLGTLRVLWVAPRIGARAAELMEMPVMLTVSALAARWIVRRLEVPSRWTARLGMGGLALALRVIAELTVVLRLRGLSIADYLVTLDPVAATAYYAALGVFAVMPLLVARQ
jgi:hypothetical protein